MKLQSASDLADTSSIVPDPFDTIKIRMQVSPPGTYAGPLECLKRTIRHEGPRALYKGEPPQTHGNSYHAANC